MYAAMMFWKLTPSERLKAVVLMVLLSVVMGLWENRLLLGLSLRLTVRGAINALVRPDPVKVMRRYLRKLEREQRKLYSALRALEIAQAKTFIEGRD